MQWCRHVFFSSLRKVEADCDAVSAGLAFQLQSAVALACDKGLTPICGQLRKQMNHRHMFSHWEVSYDKFTSRVLYQLPAHYAPAATLQQHVQNRDFPSRRVRKKPPRNDIEEFKAKCSELRRLAAAQEQNNPVSLPSTIVGVSLSDLTNTTTSNKSHDAWHKYLFPHQLLNLQTENLLVTLSPPVSPLLFH